MRYIKQIITFHFLIIIMSKISILYQKGRTFMLIVERLFYEKAQSLLVTTPVVAKTSLLANHRARRYNFPCCKSTR